MRRLCTMDWSFNRTALLGILLCLGVCTVSAYPNASETFENQTYYWRLVDGRTDYEGRLEVRRNDTDWGYVDSYGFGHNHVELACKLFGYSHGISPDGTGTKFGYSDNVNMTYNMLYITCSIYSEALLECSTRGSFGEGYVDRADPSSNPVGITCLPGGTTLQLRIDNDFDDGNIENGGPLLMYDGVQHWGRVCSNGWEQVDADVACRQLGFPYALATTTYSAPEGTEYFFTNAVCNQYDPVDNLADCPYYSISDANCPCSTRQMAGVICGTSEQSDDAKIIYGMERQPDDTFYNSGVLQAKFHDEDEWRIMCLPAYQMTSGTYAIADGMCDTIHSDTVYSYNVLGHSAELATTDDIHVKENTKFMLVGQIESYPLFDLRNHIAINRSCTEYGYVALHVVCHYSITVANMPASISPDASCVDRCGYRPDNINCRCDPDCVARKSCCLDYHQVCTKSNSTTESTTIKPTDNNMTQTRPRDIMPIMPYSSYDCVKTSKDILETEVIRMCPEDAKSLLYVRHKCTDDTLPTGLPSNILLHWPIFDKLGQNFRNMFCAICHGKYHFDYQLWNVEAPIPSFFNNLGGFVGKRRRRQSADSCDSPGAPRKRNGGNTIIEVGKLLTFCDSSLVSSCPIGYPDTAFAEACANYSTHFCHFDASYPTYKNLHCLVCNNQPDHQRYHICDPAFEFSPIAFYDLTWKFVDTEDMEEVCSLGRHQIADMTSGGCHQLECPAGFQLQDGQCVFQHTHILDGMYCIRGKNTHFFIAGTFLQTKKQTVDCVLRKLISHAELPMVSDSSFEQRHLKWMSGTSEIWGVALTPTDHSGNQVIQLLAESLSRNSTLARDFMETCSVTNVEVVHTCKKYDMIQNCTFNWHTGSAADFVRVNATNAAEVYQYQNQYIIPDFIFSHATFNYDHDGQIFDKFDHVMVCGYATSPLVSGCQLITVDKADYKIVTSSDLEHVEFNDTIFPPGEFIMLPDGRAQVCKKKEEEALPTIEVDAEETSYLFMNLEGKIINRVYFIGTLVSLAGLLISALPFIFLSKIRDYYGRGMLCLIFSIFIGQILLLLTKKFDVDNRLCMMLSIISHYAWLATFNWLNVIFSQLTFHFVVRKLSAGDDNPTLCEVILSNVAGWGIPALVIVISGGLHMVGSDVDVDFKYGGTDICWINGAVSDLLAFGVPVATSVVYCTVMFMMTLATLRTARKQATDLRGGIDWTDGFCKLYQAFKIGITLTITWCVCYIAVYVNTVGFWWLFVASNTLLGVGILFYVATNSRTIYAWRHQFGRLHQKTGDSYSKNATVNSKCNMKQPVKNSASVTTVSAPLTSGSRYSKSDSSQSEEDNDLAQDQPGPNNASSEPGPNNASSEKLPLKEDNDKGVEAKNGIVNPAVVTEGEDMAVKT